MQKYQRTQTVDPIEVAAFTKQAAQWWDEDGPFKPLHQLNPTRLKFIRDEVSAHFNLPENGSHPLKGLKVVDIGCGGGLICEPLTRLGATVIGIDAGVENIEVARQHAEKLNLAIDYYPLSAEELVLQNKQFDIVIALEIVEHVASLEQFVTACCALTKPGGMLIFSTLNRTLKSFALGIVAAEYILRWVPRGTHSWHKFVKPSELATNLRAHRVSLRSLKGMQYNPLRSSWDISDDIAVNYLLSAVKE